MKGQHFSQRVTGWRSTAVVILPMLLLGISSGSWAQTEVASKPTQIPQGISAPEDSEAPASVAAKKSDKKKGPNVTGYIQYHFNQPIDTNNNGAAPSRFRIQRARVTLKGNANKRVSYELDIDPRSPQLTGVMRDAYVDIEFHKRHKLRLGSTR